MSKLGKLLIVEDTPSLARTYEAFLSDSFDDVTVVDTGSKAIKALSDGQHDCILLDLQLPDANGLDLIDRWMGEAPETSIVVITANGSMSIAVDAMRRGAADFVVKPTTRQRLNATLQRAMETARQPAPLKPKGAAGQTAKDQTGYCGMIGQSLVMQGVFKSIEVAAPSKASVFITGETGTGKELVARAIHDQSPRSNANFIAINCGAIPKELIESELFGHVKGAFSGAVANRIGVAESAEGGTLFLDELGEMPMELQPKLLRFLQTGEFNRVGETALRKSNIRIVAATNRNPLEAVREGRLREDLYYRLYVVPIFLPPLRARGSDILMLAEKFLERFSKEEGKSFDGFSDEVENWLVTHPWPGNVRELENLMRQISVLKASGTIELSDIPRLLTPGTPAPDPVAEAAVEPPSPDSEPSGMKIEPLWMAEKRAIEKALALSRGNIVAAAKSLEINPSTIYRKKAAWEQFEKS